MLLIVLFYACANDKHRNLNNTQISQIDSICFYMDTAVFKIDTKADTIESKIPVLEEFDSYVTYYRKDFPQFAKYSVHNHDFLFIDSVFYFQNDNLIKFMAKKTRENEVFDFIALYFINQILIDNKEKVDSNTTQSILKTANLHLKQLKKRNNL